MTYKDLPAGDSGYLPLLLEFRKPVPMASKSSLPDIETIVEGFIPDEIKGQLPFFSIGSSESRIPEFYALNSGGRSILVSDSSRHYRFKGVDLDGSLTHQIALHGRNAIRDVIDYSSRIDAMESRIKPGPLFKGEVYELPSVNLSKPLLFFSRAQVEKEKRASGLLAEEYEKRGLAAPYRHTATITYPSIRWNNEPASTLAFELPSVESDLRFQEFYQYAVQHLKFADKEQMQETSKKLDSLVVKLTSWHGYISSLMKKNSMAPTFASHQYQNYAFSHIARDFVGMSRLDHTSTEIDEKKAGEYAMSMKKDLFFFINLQIFLMHGIQLAEDNHEFDSDRYTNHFDRAMKWHDMNYAENPDLMKYMTKFVKVYDDSFNNQMPKPIHKNELIEIMHLFGEIQIDRQKLSAIRKRQLESINRMQGLG